MNYFRKTVWDEGSQRFKTVRGLAQTRPDGVLVWIDEVANESEDDGSGRSVSPTVERTHILHFPHAAEGPVCARPVSAMEVSAEGAIAVPQKRPRRVVNRAPRPDVSAETAALWTGVGVGMAANAFAIGTGISMLAGGNADRSVEVLERAGDRYQAGELDAAVALAERISPQDAAYSRSQASIERWQDDWQTADAIFNEARAAAERQDWDAVLERTRALPDNDYWRDQLEPLASQAKAQREMAGDRWLGYARRLAALHDYESALYCLDRVPPDTRADELARDDRDRYRQQARFMDGEQNEAQRLIETAYERAARKDFSGALLALEAIPSHDRAYDLVAPKIEEYRQKREIRATWFLQQAYDRAAVGDFDAALEFLARIDKETPTYARARIKIAEYRQKRQWQAAGDRPAAAS